MSTFETDEHLRGWTAARGRTRLRAASKVISYCLRRTPAGHADTFDMTVICTAAAAKHIDMREAAKQLSILAAELEWIANVEFGGIVEFGVAAAR